MRAKQQRLFDIARTRRAGDQIEVAGRAALAVGRPKSAEGAFVIRDDVVAPQRDNVVVGKEV